MRISSRLSRAVMVTAAMSATMLGTWVSSASASTHNVKPTLNAFEAEFNIPPSAKGTFIMNLWTLPAPSKLVGHTEGTSGELELKVPREDGYGFHGKGCEFQVDVRVIPAGKTASVFYSGLIATVPGCGCFR